MRAGGQAGRQRLCVPSGSFSAVSVDEAVIARPFRHRVPPWSINSSRCICELARCVSRASLEQRPRERTRGIVYNAYRDARHGRARSSQGSPAQFGRDRRWALQLAASARDWHGGAKGLLSVFCDARLLLRFASRVVQGTCWQAAMGVFEKARCAARSTLIACERLRAERCIP